MDIIDFTIKIETGLQSNIGTNTFYLKCEIKDKSHPIFLSYGISMPVFQFSKIICMQNVIRYKYCMHS